MRRTIDEGEQPAKHGIARLASAGSRMLDRCGIGGARDRSYQQRRYDEKKFPEHLFLPLRLRNLRKGISSFGGTKILGGSMKNPVLLCA
jgi:hypothetical protein